MSSPLNAVDAAELDAQLASLKEKGVMVTQDAFQHLVGDFYDRIENAVAKTKIRYLKHRTAGTDERPRLRTMEEHLIACGITRLNESWWQFPGKEDAHV